jgi:hypothetical protein
MEFFAGFDFGDVAPMDDISLALELCDPSQHLVQLLVILMHERSSAVSHVHHPGK